MKRKEYLLHLIGGISSYMLDSASRKMVITLHQEEDGLHLTVEDDRKHSKEEICAICEALNSEKRPELASYYGAMTGLDLLGQSQLDLLGWQVKRCEIQEIGEGLRIDLLVGEEAEEDGER